VPLAVNAASGQFCFDSGFAGASASAGTSGGSLLSASSVAGVPAVSGTGASQAGAALSADKAAGQEGSQEALETSATCPFATSIDDQEQLATLRSFRDNILSKNIFGQIFTYLFYRNAAELTAILQQSDDIRERLKSLVDEYISVIGEAARDETACVREKDRAVVIDFLKDIKDKGSLQLKADIDLVIEGMVSSSAEEVFGIAVEK